MAKYDDIIEITGIPRATLVDWSNAEGWRNKVFWMLRAMNKDELEEYIQRGALTKDEKARKKRDK